MVMLQNLLSMCLELLIPMVMERSISGFLQYLAL